MIEVKGVWGDVSIWDNYAKRGGNIYYSNKSVEHPFCRSEIVMDTEQDVMNVYQCIREGVFPAGLCYLLTYINEARTWRDKNPTKVLYNIENE